MMRDLHRPLACCRRYLLFLTVVAEGGLHRAATLRASRSQHCRVRGQPASTPGAATVFNTKGRILTTLEIRHLAIARSCFLSCVLCGS